MLHIIILMWRHISQPPPLVTHRQKSLNSSRCVQVMSFMDGPKYDMQISVISIRIYYVIFEVVDHNYEYYTFFYSYIT